MSLVPGMFRLVLSLCAAAVAIDIPTQEITPGVHMPVLSIGTGGLESNATLEIAGNWLALGGRGVDTAIMYKNQAVVKETIAKAGVKREDVFITTKIPGCSNAKQEIESCLTQLGTDYIDLLLIHFPSGNDCIEAWKTLEEYHKKGKARAIGVSNFKKSDLQPVLKIASVTPHVNQIRLNILERDDETVAFSTQNNITIEAFSPLGRSGHSGDIPGNAVIQSVAASHKVSTYQVALRWLLQHGHVITFQSRSQAHQKDMQVGGGQCWKADADVFGFTLTKDEMSKLDQLTTVLV